MILISNSNTDKVATEHFEACAPEIKRRIKFLIDFFELLFDKKFTISLKKKEILSHYYGVDAETMKLMIDFFLKKKKKKTVYNINKLTLIFTSGGAKNDFVYNPKMYREYQKFFQNAHGNLDIILKGMPQDLFKYVLENNDYKVQNDEPIKSLLSIVFPYEYLTGSTQFSKVDKSKWNSYELTKRLGLSVCPYCNKNWINTVFGKDGGKITNPQLDHFFCKTEHPLLRLSFYNLVPSCETCNVRIKGSTQFEYNINLNPYENGYGNIGKMRAFAKNVKSFEGVGSDYRIKLVTDSKASSEVRKQIYIHHRFFKIQEIYEHHGDIISEIYFKKLKYGATYLQDLSKVKMFKGMKIGELYRMAFSNYHNEEDFSKRPFSKLTKDTVEFLEII